MPGTPNIPIGIGQPNALSVTVNQGDSALDLTTVTGVVLSVTRALDGSRASWACAILSASAMQIVAAYTFQVFPATGITFSVQTGATSATASGPLPAGLAVGSLVTFGSQPGVGYIVTAITGSVLTLAGAYTGATSTATAANYTNDVTQLGTYDVQCLLTVPGGTVPSYAFQINATLPNQTMWRTP